MKCLLTGTALVIMLSAGTAQAARYSAADARDLLEESGAAVADIDHCADAIATRPVRDKVVDFIRLCQFNGSEGAVMTEIFRQAMIDRYDAIQHEGGRCHADTDDQIDDISDKIEAVIRTCIARPFDRKPRWQRDDTLR